MIPFQVPPLRERTEDIPLLAEYFLDEFCATYGRQTRQLTSEASEALSIRSWPGNVRELRNFVQRVLITTSSEEIDAEETREAMGTSTRLSEPEVTVGTKQNFNQPIREAREEFERAYFSYHLLQAAGNMTELAQRCGMERTHLYRKLKGLGINPRGPRTTP